MAAVKDRELLHFATAAEWESWLEKNLGHDGVRLQLRKKNSTKPGIPADLQAALDANPAALALFQKLSSQNRFAILFRVGAVKRAETRARKIDNFVAMLAHGKTIYPQK